MLVKDDPLDVVRALVLSRATYREVDYRSDVPGVQAERGHGLASYSVGGEASGGELRGSMVPVKAQRVAVGLPPPCVEHGSHVA